MGGSQVLKLRLAEPSVICKKRRLGIPTETNVVIFAHGTTCAHICVLLQGELMS